MTTMTTMHCHDYNDCNDYSDYNYYSDYNDYSDYRDSDLDLELRAI